MSKIPMSSAKSGSVANREEELAKRVSRALTVEREFGLLRHKSLFKPFTSAQIKVQIKHFLGFLVNRLASSKEDL